MSGQRPGGRVPGEFLQRVALRFPSAARGRRTLLALLADFQFEHARTEDARARLWVRFRWVLAFWQAASVLAVQASGRHLRANAWDSTGQEREAARHLLPRLLGAIALLASVLLLEETRAASAVLPARVTALLLLPGVLCLAIPVGLLWGTVWAARGRSAAHPPWRSLFGIATLAGLVTFALGAWVTPRVNQTFRRLIIENMPPSAEIARASARGDRELDLGELSDGASRLHAGGRHEAAARLEVEWHKKPALGASCLALVLAGVAIARGPRSSWRRWLLAVLIPWVWFMLLRLGEQAADQLRVAPSLGMWGPCLVVCILALGGLAARGERNAAA